MAEERTKNKSALYIIVEVDKEGFSFDCDNDLNRICGYDDECWGDYFLFTANEVESIQESLGEKAVFLENDLEQVIMEKYNIIPADDVIGQGWEECGWDEELDMWNDCCSDGDFLDAMDEKYNGGYFADIKCRALKKSRILRDFLKAMTNINEDDYEKWKSERGKKKVE